jgi:hypothetical protein
VCAQGVTAKFGKHWRNRDSRRRRNRGHAEFLAGAARNSAWPRFPLIGGDGEGLLIGGTTIYDTDPALTNWLAIAAYWAGPGNFATRSANLQSGNGVPLLDATTVTGNSGGNTMQGNGGTALIYTDGQHGINGFAAMTLVTIAP